jgi:hypothetical protein
MTGEGSSVNHTIGGGDHTEVPANMVSLFKQFMETMYKQEETKGPGQEVNKEHKGKETREKQVPTIDMPESSAQGEARAMSGTNIPYYYHCLTRGHPKEECTVTLFCNIL